MRNALGSAALAIALIAGTSARAEAPDTTKDLHCIAALGFAASQSKDPAQAAQLQAGAIYYIGRVDGRDPGTNLETRMKDLAGTMSPQDLQGDLVRCGSELAAKMQQLQVVGQHLKPAG